MEGGDRLVNIMVDMINVTRTMEIERKGWV